MGCCSASKKNDKSDCHEAVGSQINYLGSTGGPVPVLRKATGEHEEGKQQKRDTGLLQSSQRMEKFLEVSKLRQSFTDVSASKLNTTHAIKRASESEVSKVSSNERIQIC